MPRSFAVTLSASLLILALGSAPPTGGQGPDSPDRTDESAVVKDLLAAHDRERAAAKLPPLTLEPALNAAAKVHADDMAAHHKMTHEGSDGSTPFDRIKRQNYHYQSAAENVAEGWPTVDAVMRGWMNSPHHRENILGKYTRAGFAVTRDEKGNPYWSAEFATPWPKLDPARAGSDLVNAINDVRRREKRPPLRPHPKLSEAAGRVAAALAKADSLETSKVPGADLAKTLKAEGYQFVKVAESAASGQPEAADVIATWMKDEASRANLLGDYTEVGAGYGTSSTGRPYWCLILARPPGR